MNTYDQKDKHDITKIDITSYQKEYSEPKLLDKLQKVAKKAGAKVVYAVLLCVYVLSSKNVPFDAKAKIIGALGYFILPIDMIPDGIPLAGYADDLTALYWALRSVCENITPDIEEKAKRKLTEWFDTVDEDELRIF